MADEADMGNDQAEKTLAMYIAAARSRANSNLVPMGECYNCGEELRNRIFCSSECREDFDKRDIARKRAGQ